MFYCDECAKRKRWPNSLFRSRGRCECCGQHAACNDVPSSQLPMPSCECELGWSGKHSPACPEWTPRVVTCPMHPDGDGCPNGGQDCWATAELVPACRCAETRVNAGGLEPGQGELLECQECHGFERIYRTTSGQFVRGILASMLELKEQAGIVVPLVADEPVDG